VPTSVIDSAVALPANVFTSVYACPAGLQVTGALNLHNTSNAPVTVRYYYGINAAAAGQTDSRDCFVLQPAGDAANGCTAERTSIAMNAGKIVSCMANAAGVVAAFNGIGES
jgi:hypothetical protein